VAATPEKKVKQRIRAILDSHKASYHMPATHGYGASGASDFVVCYHSRFIAIEAKGTPEDKASALQRMYARGVVNNGGNALLIHSGNTHVVTMLLTDIAGGLFTPCWYDWPGLFDDELG